MAKKEHLTFEKRAINIQAGCVRTPRSPSGTPLCYIMMIIMVNDNVIHSNRTYQTNLKLLRIYFFLVRKGVNSLENLSLKLETTDFFLN